MHNEERLITSILKYKINYEGMIDIEKYFHIFDFKMRDTQYNVHKGFIKYCREKFPFLIKLFNETPNVCIHNVPFSFIYKNIDAVDDLNVLCEIANNYYYGDDVCGEIKKFDTFEIINYLLDHGTKYAYIMTNSLISKSIAQNKTMIVKYGHRSLSHCPTNRSIVKKLIIENGMIELLTIYNFPDLMYLLDVDAVIKYIENNDFCDGNFHIFRHKKNNKFLNNKKISIALAKKNIYTPGQFIDYDVLVNSEHTYKYICEYERYLFKYVKKYKDYDNVHIKLLYFINYTFNKNIIISDEEFIKNFKIIKLIDTDQDVRYMIGDKIIKKLTYDKRLNLIVQFIDIIKPSIVKIKICLENCVKFPFLIWCDCEYGYKKKYKKIYEMELCYKYNNLVFNLPRSFEYATDENIIFIWKQIYKYTKILVPYITSKLYEKISVDDDRIEKFLRQISKDNGLADTKRFLIYDDNLSLTKMKNYFDILTGIADFKWNNTGILNNIIFL